MELDASAGVLGCIGDTADAHSEKQSDKKPLTA